MVTFRYILWVHLIALAIVLVSLGSGALVAYLTGDPELGEAITGGMLAIYGVVLTIKVIVDFTLEMDGEL